MRKRIVAAASILSLYFFLPVLSAAQRNTIVGHWEGAYVRLGAVQTVMMDFSVDSGQLKGTYDIPDLGIFGEPITDINYESPRLTFKPKHGVFTMQLHADVGEMTGENKKWNPPVSLHLKRKIKYPLPPFLQEEVQFRNGGAALKGTLVKPVTPALHPVIVVVHGSGAQGRNDSFYRFWGGFFARHGIATLIYDKRGVGQSSGDYRHATFDDLAGDMLAAVKLLKERRDINPQQIGLFGISQGGWIAPLAASQTRDVKFMILHVGPAVTVEEQELHRVEYTLRAEEFSATDIADALAYTKLIFKVAYTGLDRSELDTRTKNVRDKKWAEHVQLVNAQQDLDTWRRIRYDPSPILKQTRIPVLSLFGENDMLVPPKENKEKMERYLKEAGNKDVTIHVIPNVGHDMESFATLKGDEWDWPEKYWVWAKKSPIFYETIINWLVERAIIPR